MRIDVQELGADFFVFSGHKVFGPTGIGVLWGKRDVLEDMPSWQGGGSMIADVTFEKTLFQPIPDKFEAGTGNIADAVGLGAALDYVSRIGIENVARYERGIAVRTGHHCAQPILRRFGVETTVRPSLAFYHTFDEIDCMVDVVRWLARAR